ncbi:MAG: DUF1641 domain-containing protein [Candidatus Thermoplasmatota archaeon]|jgi:uncharacterized protein YjgD (DUF1641 family)|nr:DUF1641 domain-containing protein [Candidatus Thermoplasmatota archaeon]
MDKTDNEQKLEMNEDNDVVEELLKFFLENRELSFQFLDLLKSFKDSGAIEDIAKLSRAVIPSSSALVKEIGSSEEIISSISRLGNLVPSILYAVSMENSSDTIKAILYNSDSILKAMVSGAKNPEQFSLFKLLALLKDKEFTKGLTAMVNLLTALGKALAKVPGE